MKICKCKKLKSFLIIMLIVPIMSLSFQQEVSAVAGVDDIIMIGGSVIAPEVAIGVLAAAGLACGYEYLENHKAEVGTWFAHTFVPFKNEIVSKLKTFVSGDGEEYVGIENADLSWFDNFFKNAYESAKVPSIVYQPPAKPNYKEPFSLDGFYCRPILRSELSYQGEFTTPIIPAGSKVTIRLGIVDGSYIEKTGWQDIDDRPMRVLTTAERNSRGEIIFCPTFSKGNYMRDWRVDSDANAKNYTTNETTGVLGYWGYKVDNDIVYVPGNTLVQKGIEGDVQQGGTVAIPVAPDVIGGQEVYIPQSIKDWTKAKPSDVVYQGLQEKSFTGSGSIEGDDATTGDRSWVDSISDTIANTIEGVKDAVKSNTKSLVNTIADVFSIPDTALSLDFSPLMVVSKKFPFCIPWDVWNCYKVFEGSSETFKYHFNAIELSGFCTGGRTLTVIPAFDLNFSEYKQIDVAVKVFKFLELLLFIFMLLKFTRNNFMKG